MKYVLRALGQLKRGLEVLALGEMCFEAWGSRKGGLRCWHWWVKCVLWAWGQLKMGFEVLALGEICLEGMGAFEKGV